MNYSVTMNGVSVCSGACQYCSAASAMNYQQPYLYLEKDKVIPFLKHVDEKTYKQFRIDKAAMKKLLENDKQYQKGESHVHVDIWGANPLSCWKAFRETVEAVEDLFKDKKLAISTSDNGLGVIDTDNIHKIDYLKEHNIKLQLSHDGIGEWLRLPFDPLETEPYKSAWASLLKNGLWNAVNCTLSFYNWSALKNINYWNKIINGIGLNDNQRKALYFKMNHAYDSNYDIQTVNKEGRWQDTIIPELKGTKIGDWAIHNGNNEWDKHVLDDYIQDMFHCCILALDPVESEKMSFIPYKAYFTDQLSRYSFLKNHDGRSGACRSFQRYKHKVGEWTKQDNQTFVFDTTGRYSECNLIDADSEVCNPLTEMPEECSKCRFELSSNCNSCGSMKMRVGCEYNYRYNQMTEQFYWLKALLNNRKNYLQYV